MNVLNENMALQEFYQICYMIFIVLSTLIMFNNRFTQFELPKTFWELSAWAEVSCLDQFCLSQKRSMLMLTTSEKWFFVYYVFVSFCFVFVRKVYFGFHMIDEVYVRKSAIFVNFVELYTIKSLHRTWRWT